MRIHGQTCEKLAELADERDGILEKMAYTLHGFKAGHDDGELTSRIVMEQVEELRKALDEMERTLEAEDDECNFGFDTKRDERFGW